MIGLAEPGTKIWLEPNSDPKKKLKFGWRLVDHENGHFTGVDTSLPNRIIRHALEAQAIEALASYTDVRAEVPYGAGSRVDFLLRGDKLPNAYVEVKSVTLSRAPGLAEFPDSTTKRGTKHLEELASMAAQGHRAILLYLVQRTDCTEFTIAADIDAQYAATQRETQRAGVETLCLGTHISPQEVVLSSPLALRPPTR